MLFTELLTSVLSQMCPIILTGSSLQRHRCDHTPHSSLEDSEDITVMHTTVSPFPRTCPLRSLQMGPVLNTFLLATLLTTHLVFQKCSLPSVDRGYIYIYSNPCKFGGKNLQISFKYPSLKQLLRAVSLLKRCHTITSFPMLAYDWRQGLSQDVSLYFQIHIYD